MTLLLWAIAADIPGQSSAKLGRGGVFTMRPPLSLCCLWPLWICHCFDFLLLRTYISIAINSLLFRIRRKIWYPLWLLESSQLCKGSSTLLLVPTAKFALSCHSQSHWHLQLITLWHPAPLQLKPLAPIAAFVVALPWNCAHVKGTSTASLWTFGSLAMWYVREASAISRAVTQGTATWLVVGLYCWLGMSGGLTVLIHTVPEVLCSNETEYFPHLLWDYQWLLMWLYFLLECLTAILSERIFCPPFS